MIQLYILMNHQNQQFQNQKIRNDNFLKPFDIFGFSFNNFQYIENDFNF